MKKSFTAQQVFLLKDNLIGQLNYKQPAQASGVFFLKDIRDTKLQYCLDKNLEILEKETKRLEKLLGITDLINSLKSKLDEQIQAAKTHAEKERAVQQVNAEFIRIKYEIMEQSKDEFEIDFYAFKEELPDMDRAGFWVMKHFLAE